MSCWCCCAPPPQAHTINAESAPPPNRISCSTHSCGCLPADYDLYTFKRCIDFDGGAFNLLFGRDEQLLGAAAMGAEGAVGSTYNFAGKWGNGVFAEFQSGNIGQAREFQTSIVNLVAVRPLPCSLAVGAGREVCLLVPLVSASQFASAALRGGCSLLGVCNLLATLACITPPPRPARADPPAPRRSTASPCTLAPIPARRL